MSRLDLSWLFAALAASLLLGHAAAADDVGGAAVDVTERRAAPAAGSVAGHGAHDWAGPYLGVHAGYFRGKDEYRYSVGAFLSADVKDDAFIGGGLLGYNHAFGRYVLGLEGDISGLASHDTSVVAGGNPGSETKWNSHIRARGGYAVGRWLPFVSLGLAITELRTELVPATLTPVARAEEVLTGLSVGGGLDFALTENLILRGEYLYDNYGKEAVYSGGPLPLGEGTIIFPRQVSNLSSHTLRAALSWQF